MTDQPQRPLVGLPVAAGTPAPSPAARHETVLAPEPAEVLAELTAAVGDVEALAAVCARHPALLEAWARLGEAHLTAGEPVTAYACARVAYHRGLDGLRRGGWGGTGMVRWSRPGNRGFLRGLHLLLATAARLGETDESARCRAFLLDLDPDDGLGIAAYPDAPGATFTAPTLPDA